MRIYIWDMAYSSEYGGGLIVASGRSAEQAREKLHAKYPGAWWLERINREPDKSCTPSELAEANGHIE